MHHEKRPAPATENVKVLPEAGLQADHEELGAVRVAEYLDAEPKLSQYGRVLLGGKDDGLARLALSNSYSLRGDGLDEGEPQLQCGPTNASLGLRRG